MPPPPRSSHPSWLLLSENNGRLPRSFPPCIFKDGVCISGPGRESAWM
jgi:hypothetical protein